MVSGEAAVVVVPGGVYCVGELVDEPDPMGLLGQGGVSRSQAVRGRSLGGG